MSHLHSHVQFSDNILTQEFPFLSFLPGHPDMTYYLLIFIIIYDFLFLAFPVDLAIIDII